MQIKALFFAVYRDLIGADELEVELPPGSTVASLTTLIKTRMGETALPDDPLVAVNMEYATAETGLSDGDEVAFIPPVAGG